MDIDNLEPQQFEKVLRLCDIMSLEDFYVAITILESYQWDVQKAVDEIVYSKEQQHKKQQQKLINPQPIANPINQQKNQQPVQNIQAPQEFNYEDDDPYMLNDPQYQEQFVDYADYQYEYADKDFEDKKKMFEQNYVSELPLTKTVSQNLIPNDQLEKDKLLAKDYHKHRHFYQTNLLKKSEQLYERIFSKQSNQQSTSLQNNNSKVSMNKKFIVYLHKVYKSKINFTFGTFFLNLIRSYLDDKYLLVFILHEDTSKNGQKVTEKILNQPQFASFVNNNCVSYGMFDNSDDYQTVQKCVPLKQLPAFAVFRYSKKEKKQQFIASYPLLSNQSENCIEWLAKSIGVKLKKKQQQKKSIEHIEEENKFQYESISDILKQQNNEYEEIEKLYHMKRMQSKLNKQKIQEKQNKINELRKLFESNLEPQFVSGSTIQIKFRMPISGESKIRNFKLDQKVQSMFDYIEAMFQNQFEEPFCEFDLTQTFPTLSLKDKKQSLIKEIFQGSDRQNLIVREI